MAQIYSAASIYGIIDRMDAADITRWLDWHKRLKYPPRFINAFTAARFNEAPSVLRLIKDSLPMTRPVWRGYDGKDAWGNTPKPELAWDDSNYYMRLWNDSAKSATMAAGMWFNQRVKPYVDVIRETNTIVMLLNESTPIFNAPFEAEAIRLLGEEGIRAAGFRWATGTPDWPDYQTTAIMDAVSMAAKYDTVVGPHEYSGINPSEQNSLINRYSKLTDVFSKLTLKTPEVFIGEFGLAKATIINGQIVLNPALGWREMNISEQDYRRFITDTAKVWYIPNKVSFSIFCWPDWGINGSFGVSKAQTLLDGLILSSEWMCFSVEDATPAPAPAPAPTPIEVTPKPEPVPVTPPAPVPAPVVVRRRYSLEIETSDEKHALIEQMLMQIISGVVYLGQALGGAGMTLVTEAVATT